MSASSAAWVHAQANTRHGGNRRGNFALQIDTLSNNVEDHLKERKRDIFDKLRKSGEESEKFRLAPHRNLYRQANMPFLQGKDSTLTDLQFKRFEKWTEHQFDVKKPVRYSTIEDVPLAEQPMYLTRANLEPTTGGSFEPGIEVSNIVKREEIYDLERAADLVPPFRLDYAGNCVAPGDITEGLSEPWQFDFDSCGQTWWPAARPTSVKTSGGEIVDWTRGIGGAKNMIKRWKFLGFVKTTGLDAEISVPHVEDEREPIPAE